MISKLICLIRGHQRGKRTAYSDGRAEFRCPRCGGIWYRKVKE